MVMTLMTTAFIGVGGVLADGLMLLKKPIGRYLAYLTILAVLLSIALNIGSVFLIGQSKGVVVAGIWMALDTVRRLVFLGLYVAALVVYGKWNARQTQVSSSAH